MASGGFLRSSVRNTSSPFPLTFINEHLYRYHGYEMVTRIVTCGLFRSLYRQLVQHEPKRTRLWVVKVVESKTPLDRGGPRSRGQYGVVQLANDYRGF